MQPIAHKPGQVDTIAYMKGYLDGVNTRKPQAEQDAYFKGLYYGRLIAFQNRLERVGK